MERGSTYQMVVYHVNALVCDILGVGAQEVKKVVYLGLEW